MALPQGGSMADVVLDDMRAKLYHTGTARARSPYHWSSTARDVTIVRMRREGRSDYQINKMLGRMEPNVYHGKPAGFTPWMRNRVRSGMDLKAAITEQRDWIMRHGETLEGYLHTYGADTPAKAERIRKIWEADTAYLTKLVTLGILTEAGSSEAEANQVLSMRHEYMHGLRRFIPSALGVPEWNMPLPRKSAFTRTRTDGRKIVYIPKDKPDAT